MLNHKTSFFQGEFAVKLEIESVTQVDKGSYKLVAKNEKGEAMSQVVEVTEIPEEEEEVKKGNKPEFSQGLTSVVSTDSQTHKCMLSLSLNMYICNSHEQMYVS